MTNSFWSFLADLSASLFVIVAVTLAGGNVFLRLAIRRLRAVDAHIDEVETVVKPEVERRLNVLTEVVDSQVALLPEIDAELRELDQRVTQYGETPPEQLDIEGFQETSRRLEELKRKSKSVGEALREVDRYETEVRRATGEMKVKLVRIRRLHSQARWLYRLAEIAGNVDLSRRRS
jgi:DNA repair ATPase RecN